MVDINSPLGFAAVVFLFGLIILGVVSVFIAIVKYLELNMILIKGEYKKKKKQVKLLFFESMKYTGIFLASLILILLLFSFIVKIFE